MWGNKEQIKLYRCNTERLQSPIEGDLWILHQWGEEKNMLTDQISTESSIMERHQSTNWQLHVNYESYILVWGNEEQIKTIPERCNIECLQFTNWKWFMNPTSVREKKEHVNRPNGTRLHVSYSDTKIVLHFFCSCWRAVYVWIERKGIRERDVFPPAWSVEAR